jgi:hypothetical protein
MKLAVASVLSLASSAAAFQAPTMTFSLGKKKAAVKAAPAVSSTRWGARLHLSRELENESNQKKLPVDCTVDGDVKKT